MTLVVLSMRMDMLAACLEIPAGHREDGGLCRRRGLDRQNRIVAEALEAGEDRRLRHSVNFAIELPDRRLRLESRAQRSESLLGRAEQTRHLAVCRRRVRV